MLIGSATSRVWSVMGSRRSWCGRSSFGSFAVRRELDASSRQSPSARLKKRIAPCRERRLPICNGISEILVWAIIIWLICGAPGVGRFLKAVAKCAPQKEDRSMQGTSASPKVFAWLALGLFLVGLLGTILLLVFSRNDALPLIFGGTALVLALVFGAIGWRERLGRGIVVSTLIVFVISGIVVG